MRANWPGNEAGYADQKFAIATGKEIGKTALYFGCRHKSEDFIYEEELTEYEKEGVISALSVAFSRDQPHKVYVQHKLKEDAKKIWSLLEQQGYFYVCG